MKRTPSRFRDGLMPEDGDILDCGGVARSEGDPQTEWLDLTTPEGFTAVTVVDPVFFDPKSSITEESASMLEARTRAASGPGPTIRPAGAASRNGVECGRSFATSPHGVLVEAALVTNAPSRAT